MFEKETSIIGTLKRIVLCHSRNYGRNVYTVMETLSKQDEDNIEELIKHKRHIYFKNQFNQIIDESTILLYGEININNPSDIEEIKKLKAINQDDGNWVPSNFDYKKGIAKLSEGLLKECITFNPVTNFKYCHCRLGKPKRVIIYNVIGRKNYRK